VITAAKEFVAGGGDAIAPIRITVTESLVWITAS